MFEKWFGGKKKVEGINSDKNSVEGVAHFDGTKTEKDLAGDDFNDVYKKVEEKESIEERERRMGLQTKRHSYSHLNVAEKVSNERNKEKITELHSDWKEQEPFALDLPDEDEETVDKKHLNALVEGYDEGDDFEEEFIPGSAPETYEEWKGKDNDLEKAA